jgi:transcriptional regulator of acetoin/glycerol metabolism
MHADEVVRSRQVSEGHDRFLSTGRADARIRPLVAASWRRSLRSGLDPERAEAPVDLVDAELDAWRNRHPLASVMPVIRHLLVDDAVDTGLLVAVSDAAGRLLWVEGPHQLRSRAEGINFVPGAVWSESQAGTNAPGTSLALDQPVQIFAAEHLVRSVTPWSCSAAPIHDPDTGAILGALDLTGGNDVAAPRTLSIVRATVAAVESELRLRRLLNAASAEGATTSSGPLLRTLGRPAATIESSQGTTRLSLRHSEMLLLLAGHPEGMTGDQLAIALNEADLAAVTLRAAISRLRSALGGLELEARPYRVDSRLRTDVDEIRDLLAKGDIGRVVDLYRGPVLPASEAPGVARLRSALHEQVRAAVIEYADPDALLRFGDTEHGRLDWQVWSAAAAVLAPASPRMPSVQSHLAFLARELA